MSKELVISSNRHETRVALLEDDQLVEIYFQRSNEYSLAGSIHKGRVTRVLPGMQSAFVDLGLERDTFLYVSDFLEEENPDIDKVSDEDRPSRGRERDDRGRGRDRGRDRGRQDFQSREQQREREAQPAEAAPAEVAVSDAEATAGEAVEAGGTAPTAEGVAPEAAAGAATAAATQERGDRGDRDRHGRRRRRRRGAKGFPESKYAADAAEQQPAEAGVVVGAHAAEAEPEELDGAEDLVAEASVTPLILPGESLRKYRGGPPAPIVAPVAKPVASESKVPELAAEAATEESVENEYDEPIHYPPENALPDAPVHAAAVAEVLAATEAETAAREAEPEVIAAEVEERAALAEESQDAGAEETAEAEDDGAPAVASMLDEDEDRDIQAMILGDVEGIEISELEEGAAEEGQEGGEGASTEGGTAAVRERSDRYPHRMSRRRRGRGRGGDRGGEARPQGAEARPEARGQERPERSERGERQDRSVSRPNTQQPSISDLLKEGQEIIVQIAKEPLGQKGARITSHIALPGRYVVYMPTLEHMGVSRKIGSDEERQRLKRVLQAQRPGPVGGFITRTAAEGRTEDEIAADMLFLYNLWQDIKNKAERKPAPLLLHHDLDIVQRILRDQLTDNFKAIWIDSEEMYENVLRFVERFQPALVGKVKLYTREAPVFDAFNITNELEKALRPKVWLKSGGFIVINQTEALVAIDVNTGKYVGKTNRLEDTIVKTNTEAIKEIVRQIRLRDLGGIIVIDFIDMDERKNRQKVMQALEEAMRADRAPYKILQFNDFGLVAITRKRVKQSLERTLCSPCPHCEGAGYVKSVQTVVSEILTEARKIAKSIEGKDVMLRVHPDVGKVLKSHQNKFLEELEEVLRRPVIVKSDPQLHHEKFDLA
jgi:ribonuclease G